MQGKFYAHQGKPSTGNNSTSLEAGY